MTKHLRVNRRGNQEEYLLSGLMARDGSSRSWVVGDLSQDLSERLDHLSEAQRRQALDREFVEIAAKSIEISPYEVIECGYFGATDKIPPSIFTMQRRLSNSAIAGSNVVGLDDFVGNGHWSVGGGMQVAAIAHAERLKKLLAGLAFGQSKQEALEAYNQGAMSDSEVWAEIGIVDFYPDLDPAKVTSAFKRAVDAWRADQSIEPLKVLKDTLGK